MVAEAPSPSPTRAQRDATRRSPPNPPSALSPLLCRYLKRRATEALTALDSGGASSSASASSSPELLGGVGAASPEAAAAAFARAKEDLLAFERQAVVYGLYARKDIKNVLEVDAEAAAAAAAAGKSK